MVGAVAGILAAGILGPGVLGPGVLGPGVLGAGVLGAGILAARILLGTRVAVVVVLVAGAILAGAVLAAALGRVVAHRCCSWFGGHRLLGLSGRGFLGAGGGGCSDIGVDDTARTDLAGMQRR